MKIIVIILSIISAVAPEWKIFEPQVGKEGNRVVGIVSTLNGAPLSDGDVTVFILRREQSARDNANGDGLFSLIVPRDVSEFNLVYRAAGYWSYLSSIMISNQDPIKANKVLLRKKDAADLSQLRTMDSLVDTEFAIYKRTESPTLRQVIKAELIILSDSIVIPPEDPTSHMSDGERIIRIRARTSIDTAVAQMR